MQASLRQDETIEGIAGPTLLERLSGDVCERRIANLQTDLGSERVYDAPRRHLNTLDFVQILQLQENHRRNSEIVFVVDHSKRGGAEGAEISLVEGRDGVGVEIGHLVSDHSFNQFI